MGKKYLKNYFLYVLNIIMGLIFPIITFPYVTRILGPEKLGIINFVTSFGYYFMHIASFGINSYAIREVSKVREEKNRVNIVANEIFNLNLFFSVVSWSLFLAGCFIIPNLREYLGLCIIYSVVILTNFMDLEWLLQSYDDYFYSTVRNLVVRVVSVASVFLLIRNEKDFYLYLMISCISDMGARISNLVYGRRNYVDFKLRKKYLNFNTHFKALSVLFVYRLINGISTNLDKLMIGFMVNYADVGIYSAGVKFVLMVTPVVESVGIVLFPKINISAESSQEEYRKNIDFNYDMILLLAIPMMIGLFLVSPRLIILFSGEKYYEAVTISRIMACIIVLGPVGDMLGSKILLVHKKDKELLKCAVCVAISNVVLNFIMIPVGGINGAAVASVGSYVVAIVARLHYCRKILHFRLIGKSLFKYLGFCIPFIVVYILMRENIDNNNFYMFAFVIVCIVFYWIELIISRDKLYCEVLKHLKKERK